MFALHVAAIAQWSTREIHDTVAAIARQPEFAASASPSLLGRFLRYVFGRISEAFSLIDRSHGAGVFVTAGIVAALLVLAARMLVGRRVNAGRTRGAMTRHGIVAGADAWAAARDFASDGDYTGACHALYVAVVDALARQGALSRHASKTGGDYAGEMGRRGVVAAPAFRAFVADFDRVIYGAGIATASDYSRLAAAAERAVQTAVAA